MTGDRLVRWATVASVMSVAGIAALVSYQHAYAVVRWYGEDGLTAQLVPLTVDGLVVVASMVLLDAARHGRPVPALARAALALGITATVCANAAHGAVHGPVGALVGAWPALALVVAYELLVGLLRVHASEVAADDQTIDALAVGAADQVVPDPDQEAVRVYQASVDAGAPLSERRLADQFGRSRRWARGVVAEARADQPDQPGQQPDQGSSVRLTVAR